MFLKHGDRWVHSIYLKVQDEQISLLHSIDGTDQDPWPPSPPWQQIVQERLNDSSLPRDVLLGVGQSGSGHWSLVVEELSRESSRSMIRFDTACRARSDHEFLGSQYRVSERVRMVTLDATTQACDLFFPVGNEGNDELIVRVLVDIGQCQFHSDSNVIGIVPESNLNRPGTQRWSYACSKVT